MKLSFITTMAGHAWGGSEELWLKLADDAIKQGHRVNCSIFNWGKLHPKIKTLKNTGARIKVRHRFIYPQLYQKIWGKAIEFTIAKNELKKSLSNFDFVLVSMGGFCDLEVDAFRLPLLNTQSKFSLIIHVNPEDYYLDTNKIPEIIDVCKKASRIYFVSKRLMDIAIRQTGYSFPNGELIVNPVNMPKTGILPYPINNTIQFACVGRLDAKVKGQAILLQSLSNNIWKSRKWHLNIYGTGNDLDYFKLLTHNFGLEDKVTFHGFTNDIRNDIWANNHILVMPSYFEGLPIALIEAMLCGRTAVVTDVGGNGEILENNITGFISAGINAGSFLKALEIAWHKREDWKTMGEKAYKKAYSFFNDPKQTRNIKDILDGATFD